MYRCKLCFKNEGTVNVKHMSPFNRFESFKRVFKVCDQCYQKEILNHPEYWNY